MFNLNSAQKYLYLPLEIIVREHDGKVTLAHQAVQDGWVVVMGPKIHLYAIAEHLPEGVFLIKSATPQEFHQIKSLREHGHAVCSLDEEGVVTFKEFLGRNVRFSEENLAHINKVFFWGAEQQNVFNEVYPEYAERGIKTGSPRMEFWRDIAADVYKEEADQIRKKYGDFILIPTSFGIANNILSSSKGLQLVKDHSRNLSDDALRFMTGQAEQNLIVFKEYLDFMPELVSAFPDTNFVIRPHPSEASTVWQLFAEKHRNVYLEYKGAVAPLILASKAIYHFKSTTSIEAHLMGREVLTYMPPMPHYMKKYTLEQPLSVSKIATNREELLALFKDVISSDGYKEKGVIEGVLKNWIHLDPNRRSAEILLEGLQSCVPNPMRMFSKPKISKLMYLRTKLDELLIWMNGISLFKRNMPKRLESRISGLLYGRHKYAGSDIEHTRNVVKVLSKKYSAAKDVDVTELMANIFVIQEKKL